MGAIGKDSAHVSGVVRKDVKDALARYRKLRGWSESKMLDLIMSAWLEGRSDLDDMDAEIRQRVGLPPWPKPYEDVPVSASESSPKRSRKSHTA